MKLLSIDNSFISVEVFTLAISRVEDMNETDVTIILVY